MRAVSRIRRQRVDVIVSIRRRLAIVVRVRRLAIAPRRLREDVHRGGAGRWRPLRVVVVVARQPRELPGSVDLDVDRGDAVLDDPVDAEPLAPGADRVQRIADRRDRHPEVDQGREHHVAGRAARAIDVEVAPADVHRRGHRAASLATFTAATAAPTPLSMFTTVMPGAQLTSIEPSATRPSTDTP